MATSGSRWLSSATTPSWSATRAPDRSARTKAAPVPRRRCRFFYRRALSFRRLAEVERRQIDLRDFDLHLVRIDRRGGALVVHDHGREQDDQQHHDHLDHHERHGAPVDLAGGDPIRALASDAVIVRLARRDRAQIEQGETERRMHERSLHIDAKDDAKPDPVSYTHLTLPTIL